MYFGVERDCRHWGFSDDHFISGLDQGMMLHRFVSLYNPHRRGETAPKCRHMYNYSSRALTRGREST